MHLFIPYRRSCRDDWSDWISIQRCDILRSRNHGDWKTPSSTTHDLIKQIRHEVGKRPIAPSSWKPSPPLHPSLSNTSLLTVTLHPELMMDIHCTIPRILQSERDLKNQCWDISIAQQDFLSINKRREEELIWFSVDPKQTLIYQYKSIRTWSCLVFICCKRGYKNE